MMSSQLSLRDYQQQTLDSVNAAFGNGVNKQVAVLATGLGKTIIFSHLISQRIEKHGKKALIIAHREELLLQARDKLLTINPTLKVGIEKAESNADHTSDEVVIASVATIGKTDSKRLKAFNPKEYSTVIVDEAHHASATTYKNIFQHFGILKNTSHDWNKEILFLGVTATPNRNDNKGIDEIFDDVVYRYDIVDGIQNGWLSRIRALRIDTTTDISKVKELAGDFNNNELASTINNEERNDLIVKTYKDIADQKQTLIFAADVAHTLALHKLFTRVGIKASYVLGTTEKEMREELLRKFANKEIQVMINAMVLTEGYDNASIEYVFMARPTQSGILYQQMIGRGTRLYKDKEYLMIVDFVDNTISNSLKTSATLLGIDDKINFQGEDLLQKKGEIEKLRERRPNYSLDNLDVKKIPYLIHEVDILQAHKNEASAKKYEWYKVGEALRMKIDTDRYYVTEQSLTGRYMLHEYTPQGSQHLVGTFDTIPDVLKRTTDLIAQQFSGGTPASAVTWENDIPTEAQVQLLHRLGISESQIIMLNKGEASKMIAKLKLSKSRY